MLKDQADRCCAFFSADYKALTRYLSSMVRAAEYMESKLEPTSWGTSANGIVFRELNKGRLFLVDWQKVYAQAIGISSWFSECNDIGHLLQSSIEKVGPPSLNRVGFSVWAFLRTDMSHAEMVSLLYGGFLCPKSELKEIAGEIDDGLCQIHGKIDSTRYTIVVAPMNPEHVAIQLGQIPNRPSFSEAKVNWLKEFHDKIGSDVFFLNIDIFEMEPRLDRVGAFFAHALSEAERMSVAVLQRLKNLRKRG